MSPRTILRLATVGGRADTIRVLLTAFSASLGTVMLLASTTVLAISGKHAQGYTNDLLTDGGLRPGVAFGLLLLSIPLLAFVGQCSRLGAPSRERRLAAIRMAGGTPSQIATISAAETAFASVFGVAVGFAVFFAGRTLLDAPDAAGLRALPTDVMPAPAAMIGIIVGVPLFVALFALLALRRVLRSPMGVVRRTRRQRPSVLPGFLIIMGAGSCALLTPLSRHLPLTLVAVLGAVGIAAASIGVVSGIGWITFALGRILHRRANSASTLLAGRRMMADPWNSSRTLATMLVALVIGSAAAGLAAWTAASSEAETVTIQRVQVFLGETYVGNDDFFARAYQLVTYAIVVAVAIAAAGLLVNLADNVVTRRRAMTSLIAAGTPRGVLSRSMAWQTLTPVLPAVALAVSTGAFLPRLILTDVKTQDVIPTCVPDAGDTVNACADVAYRKAHLALNTAGTMTYPVHVPWAQLELLAASAVVAVVTITMISLLLLRTNTRVTSLRFD